MKLHENCPTIGAGERRERICLLEKTRRAFQNLYRFRHVSNVSEVEFRSERSSPL